MVSVLGRKGAGRSDVVGGLVNEWHAKGFRVGVIKRMVRDDIEVDQPGKDTFKYRMRGASQVVLAGRKRMAMYSDLEHELSLKQLEALFTGYDILVLEGYFEAELPKILAHKSNGGDQTMQELDSLLAICSDELLPQDCAQFKFSEMNLLAEYIREQLVIQPEWLIGDA